MLQMCKINSECDLQQCSFCNITQRYLDTTILGGYITFSTSRYNLIIPNYDKTAERGYESANQDSKMLTSNYSGYDDMTSRNKDSKKLQRYESSTIKRFYKKQQNTTYYDSKIFKHSGTQTLDIIIL